ncbi:TniQ family protein [Mycolicibacter kumamotonensis]|uniref:TniQ family protein n=1 Tax=Mycolicibacter kumamotonensis TaxID=354243 RepID=UPI0013FDD479|nr:TniQ family protein [Mycolicibacter kumamotonensis]
MPLPDLDVLSQSRVATSEQGVRAFPLRTDPLPGESLYSWLQACAVRLDVSVSELYPQICPHVSRNIRGRLNVAQVSTEDAAAIGAVTGYPAADVAALTLARYAATTAAIFGPAARLTTLADWHRVAGSQFCPHCLAATGGAWKLEWLLIWTFACIQHRCLLADRCPTCGGRQGQRLVTGPGPPHPGQCDRPAPGAIQSRVRCDADLGRAPVIELDADHPALAAQSAVSALLDSGVAAWGVYRRHPRPTADVLCDIRLLGRNILSAAGTRHLDHFVPADLFAEYRKSLRRSGVNEPETTHASPRWSTGPPVIRAVAISAALQILQAPDLRAAAAPLAALPREVSRYDLHRTSLSVHHGALTASPVLQAVQLIAAEPHLSPVEQLHYRLGTPFPQRPVNDRDRRRRLPRCIPTLLWPTWALTLCPPSFYQPSARTALAVAVLLVSTTLDVDDAAARLGNAVTPSNVAFLLWRLKASPFWEDIRSAFIRLSDHLDRDGAPIDYDRRRRLDYTGLLPEAQWKTLCRSIRISPRGHCTARRYLREHLSGVPVAAADDHRARHITGSLAEFPRRLTPELAEALHTCAVDFLAAQGITDEPVAWEPAIDVLGTLTLPGCGIDDVDITRLHRLLRRDRLSTRAAARRLDLSAGLVRYALERHPAPPRLPRPRTPRVGAPRPGRAYQRAVDALPADRLRELYLGDRKSLRSIGVIAGVGPQTVRRLMRDYGIPVRTPGGRARPVVDPDWLHTEYVTKQRSMADISRQLGMKSEALAAAARHHGIPVRTVTRRTRTDLTADPAVPGILVPALIGHGGWERLQRFVVIAQHDRFLDAGHVLGTGVPAVAATVQRLERDFGHALVLRSPVRVTRFGERVVAAVTELAHRGGL